MYGGLLKLKGALFDCKNAAHRKSTLSPKDQEQLQKQLKADSPWTLV